MLQIWRWGLTGCETRACNKALISPYHHTKGKWKPLIKTASGPTLSQGTAFFVPPAADLRHKQSQARPKHV